VTDIAATLIAYILTVGVVVFWTFLSKQTRVPRTRRTAIGVALRTLPLFLVLLVICRALGVDVLLALMALGFGLWVCLMDAFGSSLGIFAVMYVIQQWILGWPDRADTLLEPPSLGRGTDAQLDALVGKTGVASSALRPGGTIAVEGTEYPAHSNGGYVDRSSPVRVIGRNGPSLLVCAIDVASGSAAPNVSKDGGRS
jgi:hypothetical protein